MRLFRRSADAAGSDGAGTATSAARCGELGAIGVDANDDPPPRGIADACEECTQLGEHHWAHLRMCLTCGHIGCCDSSPRRHATAHFEETGHPVMRSAEPGEVWRWCYAHEFMG